MAEVDSFYPWLLQNGYKSSFAISDSAGEYQILSESSYDQIAYGIEPMVFAAAEAYKKTGQAKYADMAGHLAAWFLGANDGNVLMYSKSTGICYDGLSQGGQANLNSGAESTIEALLTMQKWKLIRRSKRLYINTKNKIIVKRRMNNSIKSDLLIFKPDDVDLIYSPMRNSLSEKTFILGAFNPGLCRLKNGNLLMMVRVAEALANPVGGGKVRSIRWDKERKYILDEWPLEQADVQDPRKIRLINYGFRVYALTSLSWLLPVELNKDGSLVKHIHYDKIISPQLTCQEYGIEDPRISFIEGRYYMTTCCASSERHSTMLYVSEDGLEYKNLGIVLDHE
jgi:hypothetical protein